MLPRDAGTDGKALQRAKPGAGHPKDAEPLDRQAARAELVASWIEGNRMSAEILPFETGRAVARRATDGEPALVVDVEGYEGPLDLLLTLARQQKVDLAKISILALADQYLTFIEAAKTPPRTGRRLPCDGRLARLPEVAAAAAGAGDRKGHAPRRWRPRSPAGCAGSKPSRKPPSC